MEEKGIRGVLKDVKIIERGRDYQILFFSGETPDKSKRCGFARVLFNYIKMTTNPHYVDVVHCVSNDVPAEEADKMFFEFFKSMRAKKKGP